MLDKLTDGLEKAFSEAPATTGGGVLDDGKYSAIVTRSLIYEAGWGELQWELELSTTDGSIRKWHSLEDSERFTYLKGDLKKLGYEKPLRDLQKHVSDFVGTVCTIQVVTKRGDKRDFTNVYINRVADPAEEMPAELAEVLKAKEAERAASVYIPSAASASPGGGADDIPFLPTV